MDILFIGYLAATVLIIGWAAFWIAQKIRRRYFLNTLKLRLLLVKLPQKSGSENESKEEHIK